MEANDKALLAKLYQMTPGPKYMLPSTLGLNNHDVTIKSSPAFSLGVRCKNPAENKMFTPAPISYNCSGLLRNGPVSVKGGIVGYKLTGPTPMLTPSSHVYDPDFKKQSTYRNPISASLGGKRRETKTLKLSPAPNAYAIPSSIGAEVPFLKTSPAYSVLGREKTKSKSFYGPAPSQYDTVPCNVFKKKAPEFAVSGRKADSQCRHLIPASNSYLPTFIHKKNSPSFYFGVKRKAIVPAFTLDDGNEKVDIQPDDLY